MDIWKPVVLDLGTPYHWRIGSLSLWAQLLHDEYLTAFRHNEEEIDEPFCGEATRGSIPEDLTWNRFILKDRGNVIGLRPALPDRPAVVTPEFPIKIMPGGEATFYVSIPLWVQVTAGRKGAPLLFEVPSRVLSNTWFGDTMTGELCYALNTRARRDIAQSPTIDFFVLCPLTIKNGGDDALDVQKLSLHVEYLRVYQGESRLWSNEVRIIYFGGEQPAEVHYSDREPKLERKNTLLNTERSSLQRSILKKSFGFLKTFAISDKVR
jgi:hypothetical protein